MARKRLDGLLDFLMNTVSVIALVAMVGLVGIQSRRAIAKESVARSDRRFAAMRAALADISERQTLYYLDAAAFADSPEALRFPGAEDVDVVLSSDDEGWAATATHVALGNNEGCAIFFGDMAPPESPVRPTRPGQVACSE